MADKDAADFLKAWNLEKYICCRHIVIEFNIYTISLSA
jgi:hypothetical protein